jgi:hypothetical protein
MATNPITSNRLVLWYAAGPVAKVLTTNFVAGDVFWVSAENDLLFEATLSGLAPTSLDLQLESSLDGSTDWIVFPLAGVLDGSIATQVYIITGIFHNMYYRLSAKRTDGDGTTKAIIYGSTRDINTDITEYSSITTLGAIIQGNVAHDDPDAGNPVKIGGKASAAGAVAVDVGDRVNADFTLEGLQRVDADITKIAGTAIVEAGVSGLQAVGGNIAHDTADAGNPVKTGGVYRTAAPAVGDGDRVDTFMDAAGRAQIRAQGEVAHDAADSGDPIKIGGKGTAAEAPVVGEADRVQASFTLAGRQRVDTDLTLISGTTLVEGGVSGLLGVGGNVAHDIADTGNPVKTGGKATAAEATVVDEGDRVQTSYTLAGRQRVDTDITRVNNTVAVEGGVSGLLAVAGNIAHDTTDAGNPNKLGGKGVNTVPTAVDNNDRVDAYFDLEGYQQNRVQGEVAHDAADVGDPVKIGGKATAAEAPAVGEADRVQASFTLAGRQRTDGDVTLIGGTAIVTAGVSGLQAVGGNVAHDAADAGNPVKIGGVYRTAAPAVGDGDRVDTFMDAAGRTQTRAQGEVAHDAADSGDPIKVGGKATAAEATVVDEGDRAQISLTLAGRQRVDADLTKLNGTVLVEGGVSGLMAFAGNVAHDGVDVGHPVKIGGKASTSEPVAVANADRVNAYYDENGYQYNKPVGTVADDAASDAVAPIKIGAIADDVLSAVSDGDMVHNITDLYRRLRTVDATYDSLQDANVTVSRNGPEQHYEYETLLNQDNIAQGTYYYYIDMTSYRKFGFQFVLGGTPTITLEGTVQADGTVQASCTYEDITNAVFSVANWTASDSGCDNAEKTSGYHYLRFKLVTTAGDGDDVKIWIKKLY